MLEPNQINVLNAVERMGATLSLFGIIMIFVTFAFFKRLRTIPNTFIFFASIANIGACVACLIGYDGILALYRGEDSPLCQAQGFIFEWCVLSSVPRLPRDLSKQPCLWDQTERLLQVHAIRSVVVVCDGHQCLHGLLHVLQSDHVPAIPLGLLLSLLWPSSNTSLCILAHSRAERSHLW